MSGVGQVNSSAFGWEAADRAEYDCTYAERESLMDTVEVTGIAHIYVSVTDLDRSTDFYDRVMRAMGFKKSGGQPPGTGETHVHYFNRVTQYTLRPARPNAPAFNSGTTGLHHLCFYVDSDAEVDALYEMLRTTGVRCDAPDAYPQ